jgi:NAD(P)-dependent dehydrogenase (short-subunit alcohol dehydrogenase family)
MKEAIEKIRAQISGAKLEALAVDLSTADGATTALKRFPDVDILVNNLGVYAPKPFEQITDTDWLSIIETNFLGGVRLSRQYLPRMKAANWGPDHFHLQRVRSEHSGGNDPLRRDQNHAGRTRARPGRNNGGDRGDSEFGSGWSDPFGRRRRIHFGFGQAKKGNAGRH